MANKRGQGLNIPITASPEQLAKDMDSAVKIVQQAAGLTEKAASKMADGLQSKLDNIAQGGKGSFRSIQNEAKKMLYTMEQAGQGGYKAFDQVLKQAGKLRDDVEDLDALIKVAKPEGPFIAMGNALKVGVGFANAAQGAMALFGDQSEETQKIIMKLQAGMALAEGLKGIEGAKDAFVQLNYVMRANPILVISAALVAIGAAIYAYKTQLTDAERQQKQLNEVQIKSADAIAQAEAAYRPLQSILSKGNLSYADRVKVVTELNKLLPENSNKIDANKISEQQLNESVALGIVLAKKKAEVAAVQDLYTEALKRQIVAQEKLGQLSKDDINASPFGLSQQFEHLKGVFSETSGTGLQLANDLQKAKQDVLFFGKAFDTASQSVDKAQESVFNYLKPFQTPDIKRGEEYAKNQLEIKKIIDEAHANSLAETRNRAEEIIRVNAENDIKEFKARKDVTKAQIDQYTRWRTEYMKSQLAPIAETGFGIDTRGLGAKIGNTFQTVADKILKENNTITLTIGGIEYKPQKSVDSFTQKLQQDAEAARKEIQNQIDRFNSFISSQLQSSVISIASSVGQALGGADVNLGDAILTTIADFAENLGKQILAVGIAMAAFKTSLDNLQPEIAIPAGIALIIAAEATKAAIQRKPKGFAMGGTVPGGSFYGDRVPIMANSGEMILNRAQQGNLFNMIRGGNGGGYSVEVYPIIDNRGISVAVQKGDRSLGRG